MTAGCDVGCGQTPHQSCDSEPASSELSRIAVRKESSRGRDDVLRE